MNNNVIQLILAGAAIIAICTNLKIFTYIPCSSLILSKIFYSPTDAQVNCLKNSFKIYIKIDIKTAPTCFGAVTPSSGSALLVLAKGIVIKIAN